VNSSGAASVLVRLGRHAWDNAVGVVFPPLCLLCGAVRPDFSRWLCQACHDQLAANAATRTRCPRCSVNTALRTCTCDLVWDHPFERIVSLFDYGETLRTLMQHIKYRGMSRLAFDLGRAFAQYLPADLWDGIDCMAPVPLHLLRRLRRGYNQADHVYLGRAVERRRHTRTQTKLDRDQRHANLRDAFAVRPGSERELAGRGVVLVDDVVTTGATTGVCAQVILDAGARCVRVVSLARD
jgi:ComF family protein